MRTFFALIAACLWASAASVDAAGLEPELGSVESMETPGPHTFMVIGFMGNGGNIFDADSGEMLGKVLVSDYTSAVYLDRARNQIHLPATYYSRGTYGERTDLLVINDVETLAPVAEVEVPSKLAAVFHRAVINPVGDKFVGLYNMTPAMSVSIVDVENKEFVGEISTAGCGFVYPLEGRRFMQICGDGTVQVIDLDANGEESSRKRSKAFFD
jgi:methylamine dehydrogenase heavy chain